MRESIAQKNLGRHLKWVAYESTQWICVVLLELLVVITYNKGISKNKTAQKLFIHSIIEDEVNKLATCEFEGRTYREGQRMFPDGDTCWKCFCTKDFENKSFELNKDCIKNDCNIELDEMTSVRKGCIPMYHKDICCPYDWRCPSEKDGIIPTNKEPNDKSLKCKFGKLELNIGDALSKGENRCSKCICTTPPMVDCIAMSDC